MLTAHLNAPGGADNKSLSSDHFVVIGGKVVDAEGRELAELKRGVWHAVSGVYLFVDIPVHVCLALENEQYSVKEELQQVGGVSLVNGAIWSIEKPAKLLCEYDYTLDAWHVRYKPIPLITKITIRAGC